MSIMRKYAIYMRMHRAPAADLERGSRLLEGLSLTTWE